MTEKLRKDIDNIVWWIPFKKLRNSIRNLLYDHFENLNYLYDKVSNIDNILTYTNSKDITSITDSNFGYKNICMLAAYNDNYFDTFRKNKYYITVLEHVNYEIANLCLDIILKRKSFEKENFEDFKRNDLYGGADIKEFREIGKIAPTTLRYIKILSDLIIYFQNLNGLRICEIGIGYGGQSRIIMSYFKNIESYTYIDLDCALELSKKYISKFDDIDMSKLNFLTLDKLDDNDYEYDIFISNYAFSELTKEIQDIYTDKVIKKSKHGYILYNNIANFDNYKLEEYKIKFSKDIKIYEEEPNTHPLNKMLIW
ncbi:hypothetical protein BRSU_1863 [Brachyspira suanatina]|uniref:Sugar O-methyltransferase n=1 Tax=Brachyspira suanatina TaxID=381802 RepID=A0A0G4K864_9SPIR|nr:putative sugar O-methyltransferase [Brachyspira suanatina]CRF34082.1 hypothetical protein BRSU_1863 [Brachyspira suanatina]